MHKFEKRDAKSRTLVILAVVGLAAALTLGIFTAVRMLRKPAQDADDSKSGIVYDSSAVEGGWDNLSPEEIAEKLNEKVSPCKSAERNKDLAYCGMGTGIC